MNSIQRQVDVVRGRQQRQWLWRCGTWGSIVGGAVGSALGLANYLSPTASIDWSWIVSSVALAPLLGIAWAVLRPCRTREAAVAIDRTCGLKDRVATALSFMTGQQSDEIQTLQIQDAERRVADIDAKSVAPIVAPRGWLAGVSLTSVALLLVFLTTGADSVSADVVEDNPVVLAQAARVEAGLEELEEFNQEQLDPELEKLLKELGETLEELKSPGADPKEALAKLSEMEAALQAEQQELAKVDAAAALQEIGEALSLAEEMKAAGEAMAQGNLSEAAEELAKLEMPKLDLQTERAVTEKLDQLSNNQSGQPMPQSLRDAASKMSQGLNNGSRSKFKEGVQGLAGECSKQGRRKKLMDLLKKQCKCLSECKCECESECQNPSNSNKKGGNKWGLGASGNQPGDKTAKLATQPKMEIKGKQSDSGDVDVETISSGEQDEEAAREYRKQVEKYKQLSESVLDSEPIPLGHRQTIRRYFELIRPQGAEADATDADASK
ncbi:MAG: hypothetical protein KDB14_12880 [Planctomycetales bacterium]|nr:hypothetical protein [Planctomycetales bacterium]